MQFCAHPETSNKKLFSTFARTRPPDTQISKSVASVLIGFNWRKVVLLYSKSSVRDFSAVARTIHNTLQMYDIQVTRVSTWSDTFHYGYIENPFRKIVEQTHQITRSETKFCLVIIIDSNYILKSMLSLASISNIWDLC